MIKCWEWRGKAEFSLAFSSKMLITEAGISDMWNVNYKPSQYKLRVLTNETINLTSRIISSQSKRISFPWMEQPHCYTAENKQVLNASGDKEEPSSRLYLLHFWRKRFKTVQIWTDKCPTTCFLIQGSAFIHRNNPLFFQNGCTVLVIKGLSCLLLLALFQKCFCR